MNWTGGRLRRHSNIDARNKKQPFRKRRSTTEVPLSTRFRAPSPLEVNRIRASDPGDQSPQNPDQQARNRFYRTYSGNLNIAPATHEPSQVAQRLDNIKRRLLEKSDWASIAAARPLKVQFPPVETLRKFGRRRRITDDDRERLRSSVSRPNIVRNTKQSEDVSDIGTIQDLDIRINGRPVGADSSKTNLRLPANMSSQSMLLDCEQSTPAKGNTSWRESNCDNIGRRSPLDDMSWILGSSSVSLLCSSPTTRLSTPDDFTKDSESMTDQLRHKNQSRDIRMRSRQSDCSPELLSKTPIRRRFTIDDQILAEQEEGLDMCNACIGADMYGALQQLESPLHFGISSPLLENSNHRTAHESTGTSSILDHSGYGWLPEPPCNIQRPISRVDKGLDYETCEHKVQDSWLSQLSTTAQQSTSPVKLYGQSVFLNGDRVAGNVDCFRNRRAEPRFTSPVASGEGTNDISAGGYPVDADTFRTDGFAMSPSSLVFNPTIAPRARIYIDQARVAGDRAFLANTGMQLQECSRRYLRPTSRRRY